MRQELDRAFDAANLPRPRAWLETTSLLMVETTLSATQMLGVMPQTVARHYEAQGRLKALKLDIPLTAAPVGLVRLAGETRSPLLESFVQLVRPSPTPAK